MDTERSGNGSRLSRRQMLKGAGALVATGVVSSRLWGSGTSQPVASKPTRGWAMVIDLRKCDGCVTVDEPPACAEACNAAHFVPEGQEWMRVFTTENEGGGTSFLPRPCMQCENAPCVNVCPVGASYHNDEGIVLVDHERCIGCRLCMAACPYGARSFNWTQPENPPGATFANYSPEYPVPHRVGTVEKCMLCAHEVKDGKLPACAAACPMNAIYLGDLMEDLATNGEEIVKLSRFLSENNAFRLKEELGTRPRVWYVPGHGQEYGRASDDTREVAPARSWLEQDGEPA